MEKLPADFRDAVDAAIEDGTTIDDIVACIREMGGDCSRSAVGRHVKKERDLISERRAFGRFVEEWTHVLGPRAEGRAGLVAIETLRMLTLRTMAELSQRKEPASLEELSRLSLVLVRIEQADKLRLERERAAAEASAEADAAARAAAMTHEERVAAIRQSIQEEFFPNFSASPPEEFETAAAAPEGAPINPPDDNSGSLADGGACVWEDASRAHDVRDSRGADAIAAGGNWRRQPQSGRTILRSAPGRGGDRAEAGGSPHDTAAHVGAAPIPARDSHHRRSLPDAYRQQRRRRDCPPHPRDSPDHGAGRAALHRYSPHVRRWRLPPPGPRNHAQPTCPT